MPTKPEIVAELGAKFNGDAVSDGLRKMGTDWHKRMRQIEKQSSDTFTGVFKEVKKFSWKAGGAQKAYNKLLERQVKDLKAVRGEFGKARWDVRFFSKEIDNLQKKLKSGSGEEGPLSEEDVAGLNKQLKEQNANLAGAKKRIKDLQGARSGLREGVSAVKEKMEFDPHEIHEAAQEAGESMGELISKPIHLVLSKDIPGMTKGFTKFIGKGMSMAGDALGKKAAGGGGGSAVLEKIAGLLKGIGPILTMIGGVVAGLVQLMVDAESAAKDFNKEILSTAGSAEFLSRNMGNTDAAATDLEGTLKNIRDAATSLDNSKWGINKETHKAVLNALTAEGVSLGKLSDDFKRTGDAAKDSAGYAKDWGSMVQMSVAYSRAFGVSLQEVSQFEGEMMSELGEDLKGVEKSFQYMTRGAEESGIATNKFFSIIRGFSADLTLFNIRMEDVTKTMVMLGKAMSPREAQKMMSGLMGMFKNKSLIDRTRDVILGGGAARKALEQQQAGNVGNLAGDVGISPEEMRKVLKKSDKELARWLAKDGKKLTADQRKAVMEASIMERKLDSKDTIDLASAIKDANPWTAKKIADAKVAAITGGKKIDQLSGINRVAAEQAAEVSDELQDQIKKLEMSTENMKAALAEKLDSAQGDSTKFSDEELKLLAKMGVDIKDSKTFGKVADAASEDFYNALDEGQKDLLDGSKKDINYQEKIAGLQSSAMDKLGVLTDFIMNQIYNVMVGIYEILQKIPGVGSSMGRLQAKLMKEGNKEIANIAAKTTSPDEFKDALFKSDIGKKTEMAILNAGKDLDKALASGGDSSAQAAQWGKLVKVIQDNLSTEFDPDTGTADFSKVSGAAKMAGMSDDVANKLEKAMSDNNGDLQKALASTGLGTGDQAKILEKLRLQLTPEELAKATTDAMAAIPGQDPAAIAAATEKGVKDATPSAEAAAQAGLQPHSLYTHDVTAEAASEDMMDEAQSQGDTLDDILKTLRFRGIKIDKPFLQNQIKETFHDASLDALNEALMDYYLLQQSNPADVVDAISQGVDPRSIGKGIRESIQATPRPTAGFAGATGGGGSDMPGGSQEVHITLRGDAGKLFDARIQNGISKDKTAARSR